MDPKIAARMIAVFALAAAVTAGVVATHENGAEEAPALGLRNPGGEPLDVELRHCRDLAFAALNDIACRRAWEASQRRFLDIGRTGTDAGASRGNAKKSPAPQPTQPLPDANLPVSP